MGKIILLFAIHTSKQALIEQYNVEWFEIFKDRSIKHFEEVNQDIPKIGKSIFSMNYKFASAYIAWYKALSELSVEPDEIDKIIWMLNENMMRKFPKSILRISGKLYLNSFKEKATAHIKRQQKGIAHPYDWMIDFKPINNNEFEITIKECAYKKIAKKFNVERMLPGICRMDYLMANIMGNGFTRTKTLGDGDDCCNCHYAKVGYCEWAPQNGFIHRK